MTDEEANKAARAFLQSHRLPDDPESDLCVGLAVLLQLVESAALDKAAKVAVQKGIGNGHMETCAWIADHIHALKC